MTGITPVSIGALTENGAHAFGQPTTAGNLLLAWVSTNSSSATFDTTCTGTGWTLAGSGGGAFRWESIWYRANCGTSETAPTISSGGSDLWAQLGEFSGAATSSVLDQAAASAVQENYPAASFTASDVAGGELVAGAFYWNGSTAGGTITIAKAGNRQPQFTDSDGGTITGTLTTGGNVFGQYAGNLFGVAGITGSVPHTVRLALSVFAGGTGVIAAFKPATPLSSALTGATPSLPGRFTGVPYSANTAVTGGTPPYTWSVTAGSLPTGLTLAGGTGAITGTPTVAGTSSFTIQVADSASATVNMPLNITITTSPAVVFTSTYPPTQNIHWTTPAPDPELTGVGPADQVWINSNVWGPIAGCSQTINIQSAHQWSINANFNDPAGAVHTFPNTGAQYLLDPPLAWQELSFLATGWDVYMDSAADVVASACYDMFFDLPLVGQTSGIPGSAEVMAHFTFRNRGGGPYFATDVQFGGSSASGYAIPATTWSLAWSPGGGAAFWNLGAPAGDYSSLNVGALDWVPMLWWLVGANILPYGARIVGFSLGYEVCSTGGNTNLFLYNDGWWHGITLTPGPVYRPSIVNRAVTIGTRIG